MIYVEMHGRLGNQMFQYAAARALQEKNHQKIMLSFRQVNGANTEGSTGWENSLRYFKVRDYETYMGNDSLVSRLPFNLKMMCYLYASSYKPLMHNMNVWYKYQIKCCPYLDKSGIRWIANGYYNFKYDYLKDYLLNGAFESPEYFQNIRDKLLIEFQPIEKECEYNKKIYDQIRNHNSICLSVRHFQLSGRQSDLYDVCSLKYYQTAINKMKERFENPLFVVFSDDISWVKKTLDLSDVNTIYETEGNPVWEKLRLMSSCNHFIIPNSTFAWWAQYLCNNKEKIVVGPNKWFNNDFQSPLISQHWIRVDREGHIAHDK